MDTWCNLNMTETASGVWNFSCSVEKVLMRRHTFNFIKKENAFKKWNMILTRSTAKSLRSSWYCDKLFYDPNNNNIEFVIHVLVFIILGQY